MSIKPLYRYITVSHGSSGYYAVCMHLYEGNLEEPWQTGIGRYETKEEAIDEAKEWAECEGLQYLE